MKYSLPTYILNPALLTDYELLSEVLLTRKLEELVENDYLVYRKELDDLDEYWDNIESRNGSLFAADWFDDVKNCETSLEQLDRWYVEIKKARTYLKILAELEEEAKVRGLDYFYTYSELEERGQLVMFLESPEA